MGKSDPFNNMPAGAKGVLLVVGTYVVTMGVAALIIAFSIMILMIKPYGCSVMSRALLVLSITIAAVFLASVVVIRIVAWKIIPGVVGRVAILAVHGVALLASYVVIAFGLMVAFNC